MNYPKISVIVPVRVGGNTRIVLDSLKNADYPKELIETFVIEGNNPSRQRNEAIKKSSGEIIFFFDDDSIIMPDLFRQALATYISYPNAAGAGGPACLSGRTYFQQAAIIILTSILGVYKIRARYKSVGKLRQATDDEFISCNLSIKRDVFLKEPGFNEYLYPNEENELIERLRYRGYQFIYNPLCVIRRKIDDNLRSFVKRIFCYGRGRIEQIFVSKSLFSALRLAPLVFLCYVLALPLFYRKLALAVPLLVYLSVVLLFSCYNSRNKLRLSPLVFFLYILTHLSYGIGEACGIIRILTTKRLNLRKNVTFI